MELICVRHGRTAWNAGQRFQGHTDVPLDDEGRAQATALAALLRGERIDAAVSSDLARAHETARIVLGSRHVPLRIDPDWREMRFGDWEGLTWEEIVAANPELDPMNATTVRAYTPRGGESFAELKTRVGRAVDRIVVASGDDGAALVATHAGPLHALLEVLLGDAVLALSKAFALAGASDAAGTIRDEVGFFEAIRAALVKSTAGGQRSAAERELAIDVDAKSAEASGRTSPFWVKCWSCHKYLTRPLSPPSEQAYTCPNCGAVNMI